MKELYEAICLNDEDTPWISFGPSEDVMVKYFHINPVTGEVILLAKNTPGVTLPRHYHTGQVIVYTVSGAWKYEEHDWVARGGSVVYEVTAQEHQPIILNEGEVIALNIVQGEVMFYDDDGNVVAVENCNTALERYETFCKENGIKARDLTKFNNQLLLA